MAFDPKKKRGLDVMIAVGKPGGKADLSAPGPIERAAKRPQPGKLGPDEIEPDEEEGEGNAHEMAEPPAEEGAEEYGAKLITDATKPLLDLGLSESEAKSTLARIFHAVATCLEEGGDGMGDDEGAEGEPPIMARGGRYGE